VQDDRGVDLAGELLTRARMDATRRATGSHAEYGRAVSALAAAAEDADPPDLLNLARARLLVSLLHAVDVSAPPRLPAILARLGRPQDALRTATGHPDPTSRLEACLGVGDVLLGIGRTAYARRAFEAALAAQQHVAVHDTDDPFAMGSRDETSVDRAVRGFAVVAGRLAATGGLDRVQAAVAAYGGSLAAWMLARVVGQLLEAGDMAAARELSAAIPARLEGLTAGFHRDLAAGIPALVACYDGTLDDALPVLQAAEDLDAREDLARRGAPALVRRGLVAAALAVAETLTQPDRRARVLASAVEPLLEAGTVAPDEARALAAALEVVIRHTDDLEAALSARRAAAVAFAAAGELERAEDEAVTRTNLDADVHALADVARVLLARGRRPEAIRVLERAVSAARADAGPRWLGRALVLSTQEWITVLGSWRSDASGTATGALADTIAAAGAEELMREAVAGLEEPTLKVRGWIRFAGALASAGRIPEAIAIAGEIESPADGVCALGLIATRSGTAGGSLTAAARPIVLPTLALPRGSARDASLATLVAIFSAAGEIEVAEDVAEAIDAPSARLDATAVIAGAAARAGAGDRAERLVERIHRESETLSIAGNAAGTFAQLAGHLARAGDVPQARTLIEDARRIASAAAREGDRDRALVDIATALAATGALDDALAVARSIGGHRVDEAQQALIVRLAQAKDWDAALDEVRGLLDPDRAEATLQRAIALARMAEPLARGGREDALFWAITAWAMHASCPPSAERDAAIADIAAAAAATAFPDPLRSLRTASDPRNEIAGALAAARAFLRRDAQAVAAEVASMTKARVEALEAAQPQIVDDLRGWMQGERDAQLARATGFAQVGGVYFAAGRSGDGQLVIDAAEAEVEGLSPGPDRGAALIEVALALRGEDDDRARELAAAASGELAGEAFHVDAAMVLTVERLLGLLGVLGGEREAATAWFAALRAAERDPRAVLGLVAAGGVLLLSAADREGVPVARRMVELLEWFTLR
jgi:tetratricopeptide (TPR) repeat protein